MESVTVYLDQFCLKDGKDWEEGFVQGRVATWLTGSCLFLSGPRLQQRTRKNEQLLMCKHTHFLRAYAYPGTVPASSARRSEAAFKFAANRPEPCSEPG